MFQLTEKFCHICGILAKRKIACWDAWKRSYHNSIQEIL